MVLLRAWLHAYNVEMLFLTLIFISYVAFLKMEAIFTCVFCMGCFSIRNHFNIILIIFTLISGKLLLGKFHVEISTMKPVAMSLLCRVSYM